MQGTPYSKVLLLDCDETLTTAHTRRTDATKMTRKDIWANLRNPVRLKALLERAHNLPRPWLIGVATRHPNLPHVAAHTQVLCDEAQNSEVVPEKVPSHETARYYPQPTTLISFLFYAPPFEHENGKNEEINLIKYHLMLEKGLNLGHLSATDYIIVDNEKAVTDAAAHGIHAEKGSDLYLNQLEELIRAAEMEQAQLPQQVNPFLVKLPLYQPSPLKRSIDSNDDSEVDAPDSPDLRLNLAFMQVALQPIVRPGSTDSEAEAPLGSPNALS